KFRQRNYQAARLARRPQTHVHLVKAAHGAKQTQRLDEPLRHLGKEVEVVGQVEAVEAAAAGRRAGAPIALVNQDQVQGAMGTQVGSGKLAQTQKCEAAGLASPWALRQQRNAVAVHKGGLL